MSHRCATQWAHRNVQYTNNAGIWPVGEAEASVSFFHLLFELLDTVQEGHHGMIELIVPEEPQSTWAVQWELLKTQW